MGLYKNHMQRIPQAACRTCGGWHSNGGMSQHSKARAPVLERTGCTCIGTRKIEYVIKSEGYEGIRDRDGWEVLELTVKTKYPAHAENILELLT